MSRITELSPKLVCLGGGGYDLPNVARAWTSAWAVLNGVELPDALPASFAPDVARRQGFRLFHDLVGHGVDRGRQPAEEPRHFAVALAFARVDKRRDLLEEHHEHALEPDQIGDRVANDRERAGRGRLRGAPDLQVAVDVIDDSRVERLLLFEQRQHRALHDSGDPPPDAERPPFE